MLDHATYQRAVELADIPADARAAIREAVGGHVESAAAVELAESPNGAAEVCLQEPITSAHKPAVTDAIERHIDYDLSRSERVVLDQRVGWPDPCYEICIDFR